MKTVNPLRSGLMLVLLFASFAGVEASAQDCGTCFVCPCNSTFYGDVQTCVKNCHVSLKCFVGICRPCKKCEYYQRARDEFMDGMIFLRAYADEQLVTAAKQKGLDGFLYDGAVSSLARVMKNNPNGWNWGQASSEDIDALFRSLPSQSPGEKVPSTAHSTNMGTCEVTIGNASYCVLGNAARTHEQVHRDRCLRLNHGIQNADDPLGPVKCKDPNEYTDWTRNVNNSRQDELEAYCAGNKVLLNWLLRNQSCETTPEGRQQLKEQQAALNSICQ
jgi:hypothetical protein